MRKFLYIICLLFTLSSCNDLSRQYKVTYDIVYPDTTITYTETFNVEMTVGHMSEPDYVLVKSSRGTNYLKQKWQEGEMVSSTCPIRVKSYKRINYDN